jgi:oligopeptide/dipeptide ABC transporter ATP-binding protein
VSAENILSVQQLHVAFPSRGSGQAVRAVDGVDLAIARGEFHGIVGESGCGKTTLARTLVGLQSPTLGRVLIEGRELRDWQRDRLGFSREVQFIFQDPLASLSRRQTIRQTLEEPLRIHALCSAAERTERVRELLRLVSLPEACLDRLPRALSGGQRQRVAIARALALNPRVLVCDEPLSALDVSIRAQILNLFSDLQQRLGLSILLIAHDLAIVRLVCTRVSVMYLGKIVETGPTEDLFARPSHPYTRALLAAVSSTDPQVARARAPLMLPGDPPSPRAPPPGCRFHTRCPIAEARCSTEEPLLRAIPGAGYAACHLA